MSTAAVTIKPRHELSLLADECCPALQREPLSASQAADLARILKALADPTRLRLVSMVAAHESGEACVCDLTGPLGLTQPTISHHLKILVDAGISAATSAASGPTTRWCHPPWTHSLGSCARERAAAVPRTQGRPLACNGALSGD